MAAKDWSNIYEDPRYKGRWVALKPENDETVVASGRTAKEAFERAKKAGYPLAPLMRVPERLTYFVG